MFKPIFFVEIQFWRKQLSIYLYAIFFLLVSLLSIAGSAGFFDGPSLDSGPFEWVNSPVRLHRTIQLFNQLILFLLPGIIGVSIYRDFRSNSYHLLYSYPFKKSDYLAAKFLSSLLVTILIVVCIAIGLIIGTNLPGLDNRQLGPFNGFAYLQTYLVYLVPNIIVFGAIVFAVVTMTRNIYAGFITVILLIILKTILSALLNGVENRELAAILDPFGNSAALYGLNEWSLTDRNTRLLPLHRLILYNRFLYMGIAGLICAWMYRSFNLSQAGAFVRLKKTTAKPQQLAVEPIDKLNIRFDLKSRLKTIIFLSSVDQRFMFRSWMFQLILIGGIVLVFLQQAQMNPSYGFKLLPVTWKMLKLPTFFFSAVINMLTFLYAGILVQRARQSNCDQLLAVSPVSDASLLIARFIGLLRTQAILLLLIPIAGIAVQLVNGFTDIDLQLYFVDLYGLNLISFAIWAALALFIQSLLTNPYLGFFILLCIPMAISGLPELGLQHPIFQFNRGDYSYSELSGYEGLARYWIYKLYWSLLALSFLLTAFAIQNRGVEQGLVDRLRLLKRRVSARFYTVIAFVLIAFMAMAIYLYRADQSQDLLSKAEQANILRSKKAAYQIYADLPQPKIVSLDIDLAFYPDRKDFEAKGRYILVNKSKQAIDTLLVTAGFDEVTTFRFDRQSTVLDYDSLLKFTVKRLEEPLAIGDSLLLYFTVRNQPNSLFYQYSNMRSNGSFLKQDILPRIYYRYDNSNRQATDSAALNYHYQSRDADLIDFTATVRTSDDQIAIAPGELTKEWTESGRRNFRYQTVRPIKFLFGFSSGRYEQIKDRIGAIDLDFYVDRRHQYTIDHLKNGLLAALEYNRQFSPFLHQQIRLIEFPLAEGSYATLMANTMPISELRLITDTHSEGPNSIDLVFYVAAHELTHHWWGNQVVPALVSGSKFISEGITEYITLRIFQREFGDQKLKTLLRLNEELYKRGHRNRRAIEQPLITCNEEQYVAYRKGMINLYAFSQALGEARFQTLLAEYFQNFAGKGPPYANTLQLIQRFREATPDSLHYLITDLFETVSISDNRILSATQRQSAAGYYDVDISFIVSKYRGGTPKQAQYSDVNGDSLSFHLDDQTIASLPLNDYITIAVYDEQQSELSRQTIKISAIYNTLRLKLNKKATDVVIDPDIAQIDLNRDNNRSKIELR